ncbi:hypothetical protein BC938DRAFT_475771 [Jimgerdemannia flammicorona]|uniref:Uncharacterized protein n=1 Tax=Jimgerdemannia flammicorona TaxID=994334 RepID=A0A433QR99_9FUNG|nr:hypothetical protein BC938DRAFT_475771 [Jimgerdemannia flammicorona]
MGVWVSSANTRSIYYTYHSRLDATTSLFSPYNNGNEYTLHSTALTASLTSSPPVNPNMTPFTTGQANAPCQIMGFSPLSGPTGMEFSGGDGPRPLGARNGPGSPRGGGVVVEEVVVEKVVVEEEVVEEEVVEEEVVEVVVVEEEVVEEVVG